MYIKDGNPTESYRPGTRATSNSRRSIIMLCTLLALSSYIFLSRSSFIPPNNNTPAKRPPLTFTKDGTFQLTIFSDLHFGESMPSYPHHLKTITKNPADAWEPWGPEQDLSSLDVMNKVLDAESQQLVILNGDLITGENAFLSNSTSYIDQLVQPMLERDLPWASTYGNHDSQFNLSREDILHRERRYPNSLTNQMVLGQSSGVSNYYLLVYPHEDTEETPSLILWFFDSRGGFLYQQSSPSGKQIGQPDWVDESVVDWFKTTNAQLVERYEKTIPSLVFVHIPTNASRAFQTEVGVDPNRQPGINDDFPLAQQGEGWCSDGRNDEVSIGNICRAGKRY
jgi:hypothetical protein